MKPNTFRVEIELPEVQADESGYVLFTSEIGKHLVAVGMCLIQGRDRNLLHGDDYNLSALNNPVPMMRAKIFGEAAERQKSEAMASAVVLEERAAAAKKRRPAKKKAAIRKAKK